HRKRVARVETLCYSAPLRTRSDLEMHGRRLLLLMLSFVGFIALGLPDAVIGVAWPSIRAHFSVPIDALGPLFITATTGSVIASTSSGAILNRLGIGSLL